MQELGLAAPMTNEEITALVDSYLRPENEFELATDFAWEDIYAVVADNEYKTNAQGVTETLSKGTRLLRVQVKGTFYSPDQIKANALYLKTEPHATVNRQLRGRLPQDAWKVKERIPEKVVSGETRGEQNPNG